MSNSAERTLRMRQQLRGELERIVAHGETVQSRVDVLAVKYPGCSRESIELGALRAANAWAMRELREIVAGDLAPRPRNRGRR